MKKVIGGTTKNNEKDYKAAWVCTTHSITGNTLLLKIEVTIDKIATCVLNETTYKFSSPIISPQKMANAKQMSKITQILLAYVDL